MHLVLQNLSFIFQFCSALITLVFKTTLLNYIRIMMLHIITYKGQDIYQKLFNASRMYLKKVCTVTITNVKLVNGQFSLKSTVSHFLNLCNSTPYIIIWSKNLFLWGIIIKCFLPGKQFLTKTSFRILSVKKYIHWGFQLLIQN